MEIPTEKEGSRAQEHFMSKVKVRSYPCHEASHMIWVYMGPRDTPPPFPAFEIIPSRDADSGRPMSDDVALIID